MNQQQPLDFSIEHIPSPAYVLDERLLRRNLDVFRQVQEQTGCKILVAQKGFSMYATYPLLAEVLHGVTSSSLFEARLGYEEMGREVHVFSPAYREDEFEELLRYSDHIVFNSLSQWERFRSRVQVAGKPVSCGLRINPEYSEIETDLYNPCFANSRLGIPRSQLREDALDGIDGLHFHTMCEQNSDTLARTLRVVEEKFGEFLPRM